MVADRTRARLRNLLGLAKRPAPVVGVTPADEVWRENKWRLLRYRARAQGPAYRTPVLLVPSLINRYYVLDLRPGKSFAEWMVARGHDVYIIDWGTPGAEDRYLTFDDICDRYIGRAVRVTARTAGVDRIHLLGYCLGGLMTTIYTAARPQHIATTAALAAPIDFSDDGLLTTWSNVPEFSVDALVDAFGNVPWQIMQASFSLLKPTLNLRKAVSLIDRAWDDEFLDGFFAIEHWGADNVSMPGEFYRRYINELYRGNALVGGRFTLSGRPARLDNIECPVLAVTFEHDHIVPKKSAIALVEGVASTDVEHIHLNGGHVGAVVSRKASETLWPQLSDWWAARDAGGELSAARARVRSGPR